MYRIKALLSLAVILSIASASTAFNIVYVSVNGPNDPGSGTYKDPFRRIQDAIDIAANGDIVEIQPGLYTGNGNYELDANGKSITIRSVAPNTPESTIIDPNKAGRGFYFHSGEDANCIISGLTITNGYTGGKGGGIYCQNSSPTVSHCLIRSNSAAWHGGGLFCRDSNTIVDRCTIAGNSATLFGGGIEIWGGRPVFKNCIIGDNHALHRNGGGLDCYDRAEVQVINCTMAANSAVKGGALFCTASSMVVVNTITRANMASIGSELGLEAEGGQPGLVSISFSDISGGQAGIYDPCNGLDWGQANIDADPCFASFDPNGDPNLWDFHLQSVYGRWNSTFHRIDLNNDGIINLVEFARLADVWLQQGTMPEDLDNSGIVDWTDMKLFAQYFLATGQEDGWISDELTSPCVDTGDPNSDWGSEPWPNGKRINMGAYGGTSQASKNGNIADLNVDGIVNFFDLAELGKLWGENPETIEDLDNNGTVGIGDLDVMAENWLLGKK